MGWFWSKSSSSKDELPSAPQMPAPAESLPTPPPQQQPQLTREEKADAEFKKLWASLESDMNQSPSLSQSQQSSTPTSASKSQSPPSIAPESLYPDTMSCRAAFDYAFFCQSLGGQFVNVYRYGELRSCSEHWENFWMCMKIRTNSDKEKQRKIRDHYRKKAIKYKTGPSSEDVWDVRVEPVQNAFQGDFAGLWREMKAQEESQEQAQRAV
ncbi:hypothetical protein BJX99DRAFT_116336 [Aspergillus californicus]